MTGPQRQRWPRWWPVLPLALVGLLVVIVVAQKPSAPLSVVPEPTSRTSVPSSTTASPTTASATTPASSGDEPLRRSVGPILGVTAGWDLFVAGEHAVMRIHPATGSIVTTAQPKAAPPLAGATWIGVDRTSVVVGAEGLAGVGYLVADDRPAVPLPTGLATVQQTVAGPGARPLVGHRPGLAPDRGPAVGRSGGAARSGADRADGAAT